MTDESAIKKEVSRVDLTKDVRAEKASNLRQKVSGLSGLKITAASPQSYRKGDVKVEELDALSPPSDLQNEEQDEETVLLLQPANAGLHKSAMTGFMKSLYLGGGALTGLWIVFSFIYALSSEEFSLAPNNLGAFLAGVFAPPALFWLMISAFHRRTDVDIYAQSLRSELQSLLFPSDETASLINKDVERLCRQAAEISAVSRGMLKSVQRARQGLRAEIRDFSGVSKKAEFHIGRLTESLSEKSGKLLALTQEVEQRTDVIESKAQKGAESWNQVSISILERADEMESAMGRGADKLLEAADKAGGQAEEIENILTQGYENLNKVADHMDKRLEDVSVRFENYTGDLSNLSRQSEALSDSIVESIGSLGRTIEGALQKTEELEEKIGEKTEALHSVVKGISGEADTIEKAGQQAAHQLGEALGLAVSGAENISSAVRRSVELLENSTQESQKQTEVLMESASLRAQELSAVGEGNIEHLRKIVDLLEQSRVQIEGLSEAARTHVTALNATVDEQDEKLKVAGLALSDRMENIKEALSDPLREIQAVVADVDVRHERIESILRSRVADLNKSSEKATQSAETIRNILHGQAQDISALSGRIANDSKTINEQMIVQKEELTSQINESLAQIEGAGGALSKQISQLRDVSSGAVEEITGLSGEISGCCMSMAETSGKAIADLIHIDDTLDGKITMIKERADIATESVLSIKNTLTQTVEEIEPVYQKALEQAEKTEKSLASLGESLRSTTEISLTKFQTAGEVFDERSLRLKDGADEAQTLLKSSGECLQKRTADIKDASKSAYEKITFLTEALSTQSSDIHLITDQALLKLEAVQSTVNDQFHELSASVGQAVSQIEGASHEFANQSHTIQEATDVSTQHIKAVGQAVHVEIKTLNETSFEMLKSTKSEALAVQDETKKILQMTEENLSELKKASGTLTVRAREVAEQMKASLRASMSYGSELKSQATALADASALSTEQLGRSVSILTGKINDIGRVANDITVKIEKTGEKLADESERFLCVSGAALEGAKDAAMVFTKQSEALFKASQDVSQVTMSIGQQSSRVQREAFFTSSKFIIESLHSLSVDLTRMLEGDVSGKTWKAFQKGDVSAFTRRLSEMHDKLPLDKARNKFAQDTEFRTYVQRFIRQFEEMYSQTLENDHDALLSTTVGSSEIGKLYEFLCAVAGKDSKLALKVS